VDGDQSYVDQVYVHILCNNTGTPIKMHNGNAYMVLIIMRPPTLRVLHCGITPHVGTDAGCVPLELVATTMQGATMHRANVCNVVNRANTTSATMMKKM